MFAKVTCKMETAGIIVCVTLLKQDLWNFVPNQRYFLVRFNHPPTILPYQKKSQTHMYNHHDNLSPTTFFKENHWIDHNYVTCVNNVLFIGFLLQFKIYEDYCPEYDPVDQTIQKDLATLCNSKFSRTYYYSSDIYFCKYTHFHSVPLA